MGEQSKIEWTHHTFNPWWGCVRVSPACEHCYAETFAKRVGQQVWGARAPRREMSEQHWAQPLRWDAKAEAAGERHRVFCASMADWAERHADPVVNAWLDAQRARLFALIERTRNLDWLLLTKRPENILDMVPGAWRTGGGPRNVWLGTTAENEQYAARRIPALVEARANICAPVAFVSYEPALGQVDWSAYMEPIIISGIAFRGINWLIVGGESGAGARAFHTEWAEDAVLAARQHGVPVHVKQMGARPMRAGMVVQLVDRKGGDWMEWPRPLRVREYPEVGRG